MMGFGPRQASEDGACVAAQQGVPHLIRQVQGVELCQGVAMTDGREVRTEQHLSTPGSAQEVDQTGRPSLGRP